jgi:hypothetical protein
MPGRVCLKPQKETGNTSAVGPICKVLHERMIRRSGGAIFSAFVDATARDMGRSAGFPDRIEKAFDWPAFENLLAPIHASPRGALGYPPLSPGRARGALELFFHCRGPRRPLAAGRPRGHSAMLAEPTD